VHTAVARICWPELGWTGDLNRDKRIAERPYYRHYSYRFMCKKLGHGSKLRWTTRDPRPPDQPPRTRRHWIPAPSIFELFRLIKDGMSGPIVNFKDVDSLLHLLDANGGSLADVNDPATQREVLLITRKAPSRTL